MEFVNTEVLNDERPGQKTGQAARPAVRVLRGDDPVWHAIQSDSRFSVYHRRPWRDLVKRTFGHEPLYLAALRGEALIDILPAFLVSKPVLGTKVISTPYEGSYGGFSSTDWEARDALVRELVRIARDRRAKFVEIRSRTPLVGLMGSGFIHQQPLLTSNLDLVDVKSNWEQLSAKHRRNVRSASKHGVKISEAVDLRQMRVFHAIATSHYRSLGVPFPGRLYFDEIWSSLRTNGYATLLIAKRESEVLGGHLLLFSGTDLISKYAAYRKGNPYRRMNASYALHWEAIRIGAERGFASLNMGVTGASNTGLLDFKSRFGAQTTPVHFYYLPLCGKIPDLSRMYDGFAALKKLWALMPTTLTRTIAHQINTWIC